MTDLLSQLERAPEIEERHRKARQMVSDLCDGKRQWIMRIPAEPDYDPDLVIAASLADIPKLLATIKALESKADEEPIWGSAVLAEDR